MLARRDPAALSILAVGGSLISQNLGAALAKSLFPMVGASGVVALRVVLAAMLLMALWRPWRAPPSRAALKPLIAYGLLLGLMNLLIYQAFGRIPIGLAVAIEATGPLAVVLTASRRPRDLAFAGLAAAGLALLAPWRQAAGGLDPVGVLLALGAAACWAGYILVGKRVSGDVGPGATAWGMAMAVLIVLPIGLAHAGTALFAPHLLALALLVAALSSALPYSLEMLALRHLPAGLFGLLVSTAPAVAAAAGFLVLGERLTLLQIMAIACLIAASAGGAASARASADEAAAPL